MMLSMNEYLDLFIDWYQPKARQAPI